MDHIMIIGGTGMLRGLAKKFSSEGAVVSVIARNRDRLIDLVKETRTDAGIINPVNVDYTNLKAFAHKMFEAKAHLGPPRAVITWIN